MSQYSRHTISNTFLWIALASSNLSFAGGPLVIEGSDGNTPVTYQNPNITLHIENGKLGSRSNSEADNLLQQALDLWNSVNTTTISLTKDETQLNFDINFDNFDRYIPNVEDTVFNAEDNLNPVVYDDTGEIIDAFFGVGQSDSTIGFAASILFVGRSHFDEGYAVINGKNLGLSDTTFTLLIAHEIGHFFGMDHSQVDIDNNEGASFVPFCSSSSRNRYPVMYPFACRNQISLHSDDISAISSLYPNSSVNNNFGILTGFLTDKFGKAIVGINIWAEHNDGRIFSVVSDYLKQGNGFYELLLPPGNYTLHANSINTEFNAGSSVGPYALTPNDLSFTCLEDLQNTSYEGDSPGSTEVITISINQTTEIDFELVDVDTSECEVVTTRPSTNISSSNGTSAASPSLLLSLLLLLAGRRFRSKA